MEQLGLKDSSRDLQTNCIISFYFHLYLVLHTYTTRFDVTWNLKNFVHFHVSRTAELGEQDVLILCIHIN